jgi:predicted DCC family thiol-disulfide oxidoreductase YuxK
MPVQFSFLRGGSAIRVLAQRIFTRFDRKRALFQADCNRIGFMDSSNGKETVVKPIVLFDGFCNLCSGAIDFILKHDRTHQFRLLPFQSEFARPFLRELKGLPQPTGTLVLLEGSSSFTSSSAWLRIVRRLDGMWPLLFGLVVIPRPVRDMAYDWIAGNRHRWFGSRAVCRAPVFWNSSVPPELNPNPAEETARQ